jgi:hypothetical protein
MMKSAIAIVLTAGLSCVLSCSTPYQSDSLLGGGYSETVLAPDTFRVNFRGNGFTSSERAQDLALLRAAELTLERGFTRFVIVGEENVSTEYTYTTPGQAHTTARGTSQSQGNLYVDSSGGTYSGTATTSVDSTTTYSPPRTQVMHKPKSGLLIRAFKSEPEGVFTFDAEFLRQSLAQKYGLD